MASDPAEILRNSQGKKAEVSSPLAGTRSQSMQRLQIGLFGLAAMVFLVSLANIILNSAEENEARVVPEAAPTVAGTKAATSASDPLADAGVVPDTPDQPPGTADLQVQRDDDTPAFQP